MKKGWDKYATEKRLIKKGYFRKYRNGSESGKARQASRCDCIQQRQTLEEKMMCYGKVVEVDFSKEIIFTGENNEQKDNQQNTDTTQRSGNDERVLPKFVDVPVIPRKQTKRKRKNIDNKIND